MVSSATTPSIAQAIKAQLLLDACMLFKRGDAPASPLISANLAKFMAKTHFSDMVAYKQQKSYQEAATTSTSHINNVQNITKSQPSSHVLTYDAFKATCLELAQTLQNKPENATADVITSIIAHNKTIIQKAFKHLQVFLELPIAVDLKNTLSSKPSDSLKKTLQKHESRAENLYDAFFDQEKSILIKNMATQSILSAEIDSVYLALDELARIVHELPKQITALLNDDKSNKEDKKNDAYLYIAGEFKAILDELVCLPGTVGRLQDINITQIKNQLNGGVLDVEINNQLTMIAQNSITKFFTEGMHTHLPLNLQYVFLRLHSIGADVTKSIEELTHIYQNPENVDSEKDEHLQKIMAGDPYIRRQLKIQGTYGHDRTSNFIQAALELPKSIMPFLMKSIKDFISDANNLIGKDMKALENLLLKHQDALQIFIPNHPKYWTNEKEEMTEPNFLLESEQNKTVFFNQNDELNSQVTILKSKLPKDKDKNQKNFLPYQEIAKLESLIHIAQFQKGVNQHMHSLTRDMPNYAMPMPWDKVTIWNADKKIETNDIEHVVECILHNCMTSLLTEDELKQFGFVFDHQKNDDHGNSDDDKPIDLGIKNWLDGINENIGDTPSEINKFLFSYILKRTSLNLPEDKKKSLHDFFEKQKTDIQAVILDNPTSFLKIFDLLGEDCNTFFENTPLPHLMYRIDALLALSARSAIKHLMQNKERRKSVLAPQNTPDVLEAWNAINKTLDYVENIDMSTIVQNDLDHFIALYHQSHKIPTSSNRVSTKGNTLRNCAAMINKIPDDLIELKSKFYHLAGFALGDKAFKKDRTLILDFISATSLRTEWKINQEKLNYKNPGTDAEKKLHKKIEIMEFAIATENPVIIKKMIQGLPIRGSESGKALKKRIQKTWQVFARGTSSVNDIGRLDQLLKTLKEMHKNTNQA